MTNIMVLIWWRYQKHLRCMTNNRVMYYNCSSIKSMDHHAPCVGICRCRIFLCLSCIAQVHPHCVIQDQPRKLHSMLLMNENKIFTDFISHCWHILMLQEDSLGTGNIFKKVNGGSGAIGY